MAGIIQEAKEKIKSGLENQAYFTAGVLLLVAVASFGLGRYSAGEGHGLARKLPGDMAGQAAASAALPEDLPSGSAAPGQAASSAPAAPPASGTYYVASKNGQVYHLPYCSGAKRISEANKVIYRTKAEAEAAGLRPAANCPGI